MASLYILDNFSLHYGKMNWNFTKINHEEAFEELEFAKHSPALAAQVKGLSPIDFFQDSLRMEHPNVDILGSLIKEGKLSIEKPKKEKAAAEKTPAPFAKVEKVISSPSNS